MAGRKIKITTDEHDRADQRRRTEELGKKTASMQQLQVTPPRFLTGYASAAWREMVPLLNKSGLVKQVDKPIVIALCQQIQVSRMAYLDVNKNGLTSGSRKNPAAAILNDSTTKIKSLSDSLGLSPQARASIVLDNQDDDDDGPTLKQALDGKGDEKW
ncbi:phage terminase small subunit P27 family [Schleiferilactobacillus harbinensis]|uniref:phage terminase small subunit P27 family n=1 Tax=Schleiferilactobacillus harbinensis TaxID=304207 RepID=UPI0039EA8001